MSAIKWMDAGSIFLTIILYYESTNREYLTYNPTKLIKRESRLRKIRIKPGYQFLRTILLL